MPVTVRSVVTAITLVAGLLLVSAPPATAGEVRFVRDTVDLGGFAYLYRLATGDFNGDGRPDIITPDTSRDRLIVVLGDGHGRFGPPIRTPGVASLVDALPGDFDEDGNLEVMVALAAADMDGDGHLDLVSRDFGVGSIEKIVVLAGRGDGTFVLRSETPLASPQPSGLALADVDGDGFPDLVSARHVREIAAEPLKSSIAVFLNDGLGNFSDASFYPAGRNNTDVRTADFDGDGHIDVAVSDRFANHSVTIMLGDGEGGVRAPDGFPIGGDYPDPIPLEIADFNRDGRPGLVG